MTGTKCQHSWCRGNLRHLYDEHKVFVLRSLVGLGVPASEVDDALQEVFLVVVRRIDGYAERGRVRAWLYAICVRVAMVNLRAKRRRREELVGDMEWEEAETRNALVHYENVDFSRHLMEMLTPAEQEMIWLYDVEGRSIPEIARDKRIAVQTAYSRLHRARLCMLAAARTLGRNHTVESTSQL